MDQEKDLPLEPAAPEAIPAASAAAPASQPQTAQPVYQPQYYGQPPYAWTAPSQSLPPRRRGSQGRDLLLALLTAILAFSLVDCVIWPETLGLGFAISAVLLLVVGLWYLIPGWRHTGFYTVACIFAFVLGSVSLVFSADGGMKALTFFCLLLLYFCILMDGMELRVWTPGTFRSAGDFFYTAFATSFGKIGAGMYGLFHRERAGERKARGGFGKALLGLLIALPVVAVLIALLTSADQAFQSMLKGLDLTKLPNAFLSLFLAIPLFILVFSQLFSLRDVERKRREESGRGMDPTILTFFLLGISLVYVAYLVSQLAYFFDGFRGILPEGFTYAEYARRGFFELTAVSVINILIVILGSAFCRKREGKLPTGVKLLFVFLCLFSLVLVATGVVKMRLYMLNFGLTRLRILTTLFMLFLAVVFLALMVHVFARKFPYGKVAVVVGALLVIAINFVSVDRMVAEYNVWAYETGRLSTVDVETITELSDAAVPSLLKLATDRDPQVAAAAKEDLYYRWRALHETGDWDRTLRDYTLGEVKPYDYRGFDLVSYQARQLLLENERLFIHDQDTVR